LNNIELKYGRAKHIIGIVSGKGGVGKSTVTASLAVSLANKGYRVGILDADIFGPSIPRILGIEDVKGKVEMVNPQEVAFTPVTTKEGIKVVSFNSYIAREEDVAMWRGPRLTATLTQLYQNTHWEELDYMLIDMPPGTGDTALTVMQSYNLESIVVVSTPQSMVSMIVKKLTSMANSLGIRVSGIVQNMSYLECGGCSERINIFSSKSAKEHTLEIGEIFLGELPMDPKLTESMEKKEFSKYVISRPEFAELAGNLEIMG
jgi:Mrp family chromosome partitioning ATPase